MPGADPPGSPDPAQGVSPPFASTLFRYTSNDEDSARWWRFPLRDGDIIVSSRSKSGTTWVQMISLLLVLQTPSLPDTLGQLSPWLDWLVRPEAEVRELLGSQHHRRVIKTHTPLDGVPQDPRATYVVVARHPLDAAVSLYHHSKNLDRERLRALMGRHGRHPFFRRHPFSRRHPFFRRHRCRRRPSGVESAHQGVAARIRRMGPGPAPVA